MAPSLVSPRPESCPEEQLAEVLGSARAEIGRLVPELQHGLPAAPRPSAIRPHCSSSWSGVIARLAAATPLMLVFEDLQRADGQRLDLLALLVARSNASASRTLRPRLRRSWPIHLPPDRAKLGLATRLEAATVAHRLGLTPALGAPEVPGRDI